MKRLTVITVTFNAEQTLPRTLHSVMSQTVFDEQIDYIVVDGGSKDHTMELILPHASRLARLFHEPDHGIFDAMNKGAAAAETPWVMFLNAGDEFLDSETVASLHLEAEEPDHIIYGDCIRVYADGQRKLQKAQPFFKANGYVPGIGICHQSMYIPTTWMKEHPYLWQQYPTALTSNRSMPSGTKAVGYNTLTARSVSMPMAKASRRMSGTSVRSSKRMPASPI